MEIKMKIVIFEIEQWEYDNFKQLSQDHEVQYIFETLSKDNVEQFKDADIISTFIYSKLDRKVLEKFNHLKFIATRSTGFDHIDIQYCNEKGIFIANVPVYGENTVAEHVFALLLTISHHMYEAIDRTKKGDFSIHGLRGFDLKNKVMGVIGTGNIGQQVIQIAKGFNMKVIAHDIKRKEKLANELDFQYVPFDKLLNKSDIISLHVPANHSTENLIAEEQFNKMKQGVILINTSRGQIINSSDLTQALAEGKVEAAGIDVLPEEPVIREEAELLRSIYEEKHDLQALLTDCALLRLKNVIITPHNAFNTQESIQRILQTTVENLQSYIQGSPENIVNEPK